MLRSWFPPALAAVAAVLVCGAFGRAGDAEALATVRAFERDLEALIARVSSSVVTVGAVVDDEDGFPVKSGGSGVVIDASGYVLTNDHVTEGQTEAQVGFADGRVVTARVVARDRQGDLALLRVDATGLTPASFGDSEALRPGQRVLALGNPFGLAGDTHVPAASLGIVSATQRYLGGSKVYGEAIQIDAPVNPGNSGGPLFDLEGRLVGLNGRISVRGADRHNVGVGFAIPLHQILLVLDDLKAGRDVERGYLGVRFLTAKQGRGVVVRDVLPRTPASSAGLRAGDRILAVEGPGVGRRAITQPVRLQNALAILPAGTQVTLVLEREGERLTVQVVLARRPPQ
ncbi:MAG: trypsin-like peptidase domain-containing protein [Planctomycetes bacterium]|nr:trypsin-like peptidase domain-containing protein [Planctomycetota bacterium]